MSISRVEVDTIEDLFVNGMKRRIAVHLPAAPSGEVLNLGSGNNPISGATNLDRPFWEAPRLADVGQGSIASVHAYHFLEHLDSRTVSAQLWEIDRVLKPGGLFYYCVPYAMSPIAFMDVDHKTFWTEETMRTLTDPRGYASAYAPNPKLEIIWQVIMGLTSQNLAVLGVLQKKGSVGEG